MRIRILVGVVAVLLVLAGLFYAIGKEIQQKPPEATSAVPSSAFDIPASTTTSVQPAVVPPADSVPYHSATYSFSLYYPSVLSAKSYDEGGDAATVTFQSASAGKGFQIFIKPYTMTQVTEATFMQDEPSGVRNDARAARVGGASGAAFYGHDQALGDTYEVWFIHGGYLYEVTTLKPLENWLNGILATWRFQ